MSVLVSGRFDREMECLVVVARNNVGDLGIFCAAKGFMYRRVENEAPQRCCLRLTLILLAPTGFTITLRERRVLQSREVQHSNATQTSLKRYGIVQPAIIMS